MSAVPQAVDRQHTIVDLRVAASSGSPSTGGRLAIERARVLLAPERQAGAKYPVDALGPMADACKAIAAVAVTQKLRGRLSPLG